MEYKYVFTIGDWVDYHGTITTIDDILSDDEVSLAIHDELQPIPIKISNLIPWSPKDSEVCIFFNDHSDYVNTHFVISPYGGCNERDGEHLATSNQCYYDNVMPIEFALSISKSDFDKGLDTSKPQIKQPINTQSKQEKKYIYQYCTTKYQELGKIEHIDGILTLTFKITTMDEYRDVKKLIDPIEYDKLIITSLSLLNEVVH